MAKVLINQERAVYGALDLAPETIGGPGALLRKSAKQTTLWPSWSNAPTSVTPNHHCPASTSP